jgi:hypothetical protein
MDRTYHKIAAFSLVSMLLLSPAVSFAKNNGEGKNNAHKIERGDDRKDNQSNSKKISKAKEEKRHCFKAFGHLFARGFIKNKGEIEFPADCFMPFGIKKKFGGVASSTDSTAPAITNLSVRPNTVRALITWQTDEKSDSTVFWSTSPEVDTNSSSTLNIVKSERVKDHSITIQNLTASTTYYLLVRSKDASSNTATSSVISFRTHSLPLDTTPPVISTLGYLPATSTVMFSWKTNENSSSRVYFSTTSPLVLNASSTANVFSSTLTKDHLMTASDLTASTTYYIAVESVDQSGNKTTSPSFIVTTH